MRCCWKSSDIRLVRLREHVGAHPSPALAGAGGMQSMTGEGLHLKKAASRRNALIRRVSRATFSRAREKASRDVSYFPGRSDVISFQICVHLSPSSSNVAESTKSSFIPSGSFCTFWLVGVKSRSLRIVCASDSMNS